MPIPPLPALKGLYLLGWDVAPASYYVSSSHLSVGLHKQKRSTGPLKIGAQGPLKRGAQGPLKKEGQKEPLGLLNLIFSLSLGVMPLAPFKAVTLLIKE